MNVRTMTLAAVLSMGAIGTAFADPEGGGMAATETRAGTGVYFSGPLAAPSVAGLPTPVATLPRAGEVEVAMAPSSVLPPRGAGQR